MPKAPRPTAVTKIFGFCEAFLSYFVMSQSNKNDQIVVSTLQHVTIISDKFLKPNGIKNQRGTFLAEIDVGRKSCEVASCIKSGA